MNSVNIFFFCKHFYQQTLKPVSWPNLFRWIFKSLGPCFGPKIINDTTLKRLEIFQSVIIGLRSWYGVQGFVDSSVLRTINGIGVHLVHIGWEIVLGQDGFASPGLFFAILKRNLIWIFEKFDIILKYQFWLNIPWEKYAWLHSWFHPGSVQDVDHMVQIRLPSTDHCNHHARGKIPQLLHVPITWNMIHLFLNKMGQKQFSSNFILIYLKIENYLRLHLEVLGHHKMELEYWFLFRHCHL